MVASAKRMAEQLVVEVSGASPQLEGLEKAVLAALHELGNEMLCALAVVWAPAYPPACLVCACGGDAHYQRQRSAQCQTLLGTIVVRRPYYLCSACHQGFAPLDGQLGLCAGSISAGLDELLALLGCQFSFAHSAELVKRLTLVEVSANRCRRSTEALGQRVVEADETARQTAWEQPELPLPPVSEMPLDPLYISADGVTVHTRERGWREQCVGAIYTAQPAPGATTPPTLRAQQTSFVTELGARTQFTQSLWLEAQRRGLQTAATQVFIGDGAHWLWETAQELFPSAIQILDWYHATTYVWKVANDLSPSDAQTAKAWADDCLSDLWASRTAAVLQRLQPLATHRRSAQEALTYFTNNQTRMDYARYRANHLQTGSGTIESACNHLIAQRLKQAGMRWNTDHARAVAKVRARLKSDRWAETLALRPPPHRPYRHHPLPI
jgi:hypothetical protein